MRLSIQDFLLFPWKALQITAQLCFGACLRHRERESPPSSPLRISLRGLGYRGPEAQNSNTSGVSCRINSGYAPCKSCPRWCSLAATAPRPRSQVKHENHSLHSPQAQVRLRLLCAVTQDPAFAQAGAGIGAVLRGLHEGEGDAMNLQDLHCATYSYLFNPPR